MYMDGVEKECSKVKKNVCILRNGILRKMKLKRRIDQSHRNLYANKVLNSKKWIEIAEELLAAARILEPYVEEWWLNRRKYAQKKKRFFRYNYHGIYLMFVAYAIENLCKANVISSLTQEEKIKIKKEGTLPKIIKSHNLPELVKQIGLKTTIKEELLLARLVQSST